MKNLVFLLCIWTASPLLAQKDSSYIETFDDYLVVKASVHNSTLNFALSPRVNGLTQYLKPFWYRPGVQNIVGVGASFKGLSLNLSFKLRQNRMIRNRQGESDYFNFQIHSYGHKFGYDIYYQKYKGYFISNFDNFFTDFFAGDPLQRRDDLTLRNLSTNVYYIFNPEKFSSRSSFVLDERQVRSGGSFILMGSLGYFRASADSSIVPPDNDLNFRSEAFFNATGFYTLSASPGYAFTIVLPKGFYFSVGASGMVGMQYFEGEGENLSDQGFNYFLKGVGKSSLGYNKEKWVVGVSLCADIQGMNTRHVQFRTNNLDIGFFVAHRIKTNWLKGKKSVFDFLKKKKKTDDKSL